jgi:hypothetical protein
MKKFTITALTALIISSTSLYANPITQQANDTFNLINETNFPLSIAINNVCSSEIGNISAHSNKTFATSQIVKACGDNDKCEILAFDDVKCLSNTIGGVTVDFKSHFMIVYSKRNTINITGTVNINNYSISFSEIK